MATKHRRVSVGDLEMTEADLTEAAAARQAEHPPLASTIPSGSASCSRSSAGPLDKVPMCREMATHRNWSMLCLQV